MKDISSHTGRLGFSMYEIVIYIFRLKGLGYVIQPVFYLHTNAKGKFCASV